MRALQAILLILIIGLYSCGANETKIAAIKSNPGPDTTKSINKIRSVDTSREANSFIDSFPRFEVDDYPITQNMLTCSDHSSACEIKYGDIVSLDKIWFTNDALKQSLVFEMYTDGFRNAIFHFDN